MSRAMKVFAARSVATLVSRCPPGIRLHLTVEADGEVPREIQRIVYQFNTGEHPPADLLPKERNLFRDLERAAEGKAPEGETKETGT